MRAEQSAQPYNRSISHVIFCFKVRILSCLSGLRGLALTSLNVAAGKVRTQPLNYQEQLLWCNETPIVHSFFLSVQMSSSCRQSKIRDAAFSGLLGAATTKTTLLVLDLSYTQVCVLSANACGRPCSHDNFTLSVPPWL